MKKRDFFVPESVTSKPTVLPPVGLQFRERQWCREGLKAGKRNEANLLFKLTYQEL